MNKIKTFRGRDGVEVSLSKQNDNYYITAKGKRPAPRIYRNSNGTIYGIERFASPVTRDPIPLRANNKKDAEYQVEKILEVVEGATMAAPPPRMPEPELPEWVKQLGKPVATAAAVLPPPVEASNTAVSAVNDLSEWLGQFINQPRQSSLTEGINFLLGIS